MIANDDSEQNTLKNLSFVTFYRFVRAKTAELRDFM